MSNWQEQQKQVATGVTDNTHGYTLEEIEGIRKMHEEGRCMPFIEFKLANGLTLRMLKSGGSYVCALNPQTAHNFLTGEWK